MTNEANQLAHGILYFFAFVIVWIICRIGIGMAFSTIAFLSGGELASRGVLDLGVILGSTLLAAILLRGYWKPLSSNCKVPQKTESL